MSRLTIVLVHGSGHTSRVWEATQAALSHPALAVDLPGRGARPVAITTVTIDDAAEAIAADVRAAVDGDVVLAGHSAAGIVLPAAAARLARACGTWSSWRPSRRVTGSSLWRCSCPGQADVVAAQVAGHRRDHGGRTLESIDVKTAGAIESLNLSSQRVSWEGVPASLGRTFIRCLRDPIQSREIQARFIANWVATEVIDSFACTPAEFLSLLLPGTHDWPLTVVGAPEAERRPTGCCSAPDSDRAAGRTVVRGPDTRPGTGGTAMNIASYVGTDDFFGAPYIDVDEERATPLPHRHIHGGFEGTATRFSFYFPPADQYRGRFIQPLEGGLGGHENLYGGPLGERSGGIDFAVGLGAYLVESNQGHIGSEIDPKAGNDGSIYTFRASAEAARFARFLAAEIYGSAPHHGYVYGGSGGAVRSSACIENVYDVWAGAMPYMGGGVCPPAYASAPGTGALFATLYNAQRLLGDQLADVVDALEPGGSNEPFATLNTRQRIALYDLYREGFPRGVERMLAFPMGQIASWAWTAEQRYQDDPEYYDNFWTTPGYAGHDDPAAFATDLIAGTRVTVRAAVSAGDLANAEPGTPERMSPWSGLAAGMWGADMAIGVTIDKPAGYLQGAGIRIVTGAAAGRLVFCMGVAGDTILVDGMGEAGNLRFAGVLPGDEIEIDNRLYLAYCYRYRHVVDVNDPSKAHLAIDGRPLFPQRPPAATSATGIFGGTGAFTQRFQGKVLHWEHTHDSSIWPRARNPETIQDRYVLRWTENAEHGSSTAMSVAGVPVPTTRLIDYKGTIEQGLHDLVAWVEEGVRPTETAYRLEPGEAIVLPADAAQRGGIQAVVTATANGGTRADVKVGEPVTLAVTAEVPPGAGTVVRIEWDVDGTGTWPYRVDAVDGSRARVETSLTHIYDRPGTFFATARVQSHRDGDVGATSRLVENIGRVRVVVG